MANAAKGLGKINDYVTERFDGNDPGEFNSFMQQFDLGVSCSGSRRWRYTSQSSISYS